MWIALPKITAYLNRIAAFKFLETVSSRHLPFQSQKWEHQYNEWNVFKINNKDTTTTLMMPFITEIVNGKLHFFVQWKFTNQLYLQLIYEENQSRSSRPEVFCKKGVLRKFAKFTGEHLCQGFFFNKVAGLTSATLLKSRLWLRCFPVNYTKLLRTPFLQNTSGSCFC